MRVYYGQNLPAALAVAAAGAAVLLATLSYRLVEQPFMHVRTADFPFLRVGGMAMAVGTAVLVPFIYAGGFPGRFSPDTVALFAAGEDYNPKRSECHNGDDAPMPYGDNCIFGAEGNARVLAVWGDSHGTELAYALGSRSRDLRMNVLEITSSACPPALNYAPPRPGPIRQGTTTIRSKALSMTAGRIVVLTTNGIGYRSNTSGLIEASRALSRTDRKRKKVILVEQQDWFQFRPAKYLVMPPCAARSCRPSA